MKILKSLKYILFTLLICYSFNSYSQFILSGEIRPRFEYRYGYKQMPDNTKDPAFFVSQRSRIVMKYDKKESFKTNISIQDIRTWGDEQLKTDVAGLGIYEAWAEVHLFDSLNAKVGRQELVYDNQRFLSNTNWQQKGLTHDMLLLKYKRNKLSADFGSAFNQQDDKSIFGTSYTNTTISGNYKTLNFLWLTQDIKMVKISLVGFLEGFQKRATQNTTYARGTYGSIIKLDIKNFNLYLRGFLQTGKDTAGTNINSYYMNSDLIYSFPKTLKLTAGFEYFSGKNATNSSNKNVNAFYPLYGTTHTFNGNMDYFTDIPKDTKNAGLVDIYLKFDIKVFKNTNFNADFHYFALQNKYVYNNNVIDKYLGMQDDFSFKINIKNDVTINLGYSFLVGTKSLEIIQARGNKDKLASWAWVMLTVKPEFLKF